MDGSQVVRDITGVGQEPLCPSKVWGEGLRRHSHVLVVNWMPRTGVLGLVCCLPGRLQMWGRVV